MLTRRALRNLAIVSLVTASLPSLPACTVVEDLADEPAALDVDPVKACPIPALDALPGNETLFYDCAEEAADHGNGCGETGYFVGYGARYAERFYQQTRPTMSWRGRRWIDEVLVCLQRDLRDAIDETTSCDDAWELAFDSHPACYVEAGFCTLSPLDLLRVVWTIDLDDWLSADAARQVVHTAASCSYQYALLMSLFFGDLLDD
jgi:hypothetical protein